MQYELIKYNSGFKALEFKYQVLPALSTKGQHWYTGVCEPEPLCAVWHQFLGQDQAKIFAGCHPDFVLR